MPPGLRPVRGAQVLSIGQMGIVIRYRDTIDTYSQEVAMRPSSADHRAAQSARDALRDGGAPQRPLDPTKRPRRKALADTRERPARSQRRPAGRAGDGEPLRGLPSANARPGSRTREAGPPTGHVVGHRFGQPAPRPRDANRPAGRVGPYDDVVAHPEIRPLLTEWVIPQPATGRVRSAG
jgi:hypothetical protein